ncbi:hypothetical protein E8E14_004465 [Neopestalotiopsis sp. 37M]|nr:hypothetical protein E8E14_004465 [Neopestalotiopsis sp. 37M]
MAGVEGQLWGLGIEAAIDPAEWAEKRAGKGKLDAIEARQLDYCAGYSGVGRRNAKEASDQSGGSR